MELCGLFIPTVVPVVWWWDVFILDGNRSATISVYHVSFQLCCPLTFKPALIPDACQHIPHYIILSQTDCTMLTIFAGGFRRRRGRARVSPDVFVIFAHVRADASALPVVMG